jgi:hypothetical protein
VKTE